MILLSLMRDGAACDCPPKQSGEKAARGVKARRWPWGNTFTQRIKKRNRPRECLEAIGDAAATRRHVSHRGKSLWRV